MFSLKRPTEDEIRKFLQAQASAPFTYRELGMSGGPAPSGYVTNHHRVRLGSGEETFTAACDAVRGWAMFDVPWVTLCGRDAPIEPGSVVGILVRRLGLWSLNACRIVETINDPGQVTRFGFRYGTLPEHIERGEEQFLVEWNHDDDTVWYDLRAHSRPGHWVARWGRPVVRHSQRKFGRQSLAGMRRAVAARLESRPTPERIAS